MTGKWTPRSLEVAVGEAVRAQEVGAAHLEPREVFGVMGDSHLVGLRVAHADAGAGAGARGQRAASSSLRASRSASPAPNTACPATRIVSTRLGQRADVAHVHAAVHLDARAEAAVLDLLAQPAHLVEAAGQELLAAEPRVDRHHQHVVELGQDLLERGQRRRGVDGHAGLDPAVLQVGHRPLEVGQRLRVQADPRRPGVDECVEVAVRVLDHQVHVQGQRGGAPDRFHHRRTQGDVGDEVPVHHVDVDRARAAALGGGDVLAEPREVRGQDRRRQDHCAALLTSSATAARGVTRYPDGGVWRRTTPGSTPR